MPAMIHRTQPRGASPRPDPDRVANDVQTQAAVWGGEATGALRCSQRGACEPRRSLTIAFDGIAYLHVSGLWFRPGEEGWGRWCDIPLDGATLIV